MRVSTRLLALALLTGCGRPFLLPMPPPLPMEPAQTTNIDVGRTSSLEDVRRAGVDLRTAPARLADLPPKTKLRLMPLFAKSLGTGCDGCHVAGDFRTDTRNKRIAREMWTSYVRGLRSSDGEPIFCDTCHGGRRHFIARGDDFALAAWMKKNFVGQLTLATGGEPTCATCHGEKPFAPDIFKARFHAE